jgi:hypothetical protein
MLLGFRLSGGLTGVPECTKELRYCSWLSYGLSSVNTRHVVKSSSHTICWELRRRLSISIRSRTILPRSGDRGYLISTLFRGHCDYSSEGFSRGLMAAKNGSQLYLSRSTSGMRSNDPGVASYVCGVEASRDS